MSDSPYVLDVTAEDFSQIVVENSWRFPVLVDFWADWCAPCRALTPVLVKLADEFGGRFLVAKVNTEEQQGIAAEFQIRSLPTVKLFRNGEVMDEFMGALPESAIREFIDRYVERASDKLREQATASHRAGDSEQAVALLRTAVSEDPTNYRLHRDLLQILLETRRFAEAEELLRTLPANQRTSPEFTGMRNRLQFGLAAEGAPDAGELEQTIQADPANSEARYQLGAIHVLAGDYEPALEQLLQIMRRDRAFRDDAARKGMVAIFELLDGKGPLVTRYRSLMSSALH